jgi:hypothetical protein
MNPVLTYSLALRALLTPLLVATKGSVIGTVAALILLDIVDCNPIVVKLFQPEYKAQGCSYDPNYQILDKVLDIFQYFIAILLLEPILPKSIYVTTLFFLVYRIIGIAIYLVNKNNKTFEIFIDFVKEYLLLSVLFSPLPMPVLLASVLLKVGYEYLMHDKHIFLDLYRRLFE